jgi:hypothetical protein
MNVFTNDAYFKAQVERAGRLLLYGLLCLALAFGAALYFQFFDQRAGLLVLLSYPFLLAGFPMWTVGNNRLRMYKQTTRPDHKITAELKGFNDKYSLHHYATVSGRTVKHLFIAPSGIVVIESNETLGPVSGNDDKWKARTGLLERFGGVNAPVGNPTTEVQAGIAAVRELVASIGKPDVAIGGLIVFTRAKEIEEHECSYPAVPLAETRSAVRDVIASIEPEGEDRNDVSLFLTSEDRRKLNQILAPEKSAAPAKPTVARTQAKNQ